MTHRAFQKSLLAASTALALLLALGSGPACTPDDEEPTQPTNTSSPAPVEPPQTNPQAPKPNAIANLEQCIIDYGENTYESTATEYCMGKAGHFDFFHPVYRECFDWYNETTYSTTAVEYCIGAFNPGIDVPNLAQCIVDYGEDAYESTATEYCMPRAASFNFFQSHYRSCFDLYNQSAYSTTSVEYCTTHLNTQINLENFEQCVVDYGEDAYESTAVEYCLPVAATFNFFDPLFRTCFDNYNKSAYSTTSVEYCISAMR